MSTIKKIDLEIREETEIENVVKTMTKMIREGFEPTITCTPSTHVTKLHYRIFWIFLLRLYPDFVFDIFLLMFFHGYVF